MFAETDLITAENYITASDLAFVETPEQKQRTKKGLSFFQRVLDFDRREYQRLQIIAPGKDKVIFFVKTDLLDYFFSSVRPYLTQKYTIITGYSDHTVPVGGEGDFSSWLKDELLVSWFGYNLVQAHPKLKPVPLGIPPKIWLRFGHEAGRHDLFIETLNHFLQVKPARRKIAYWGSQGATTNSRTEVFEQIQNLDYITITDRRNYLDYLQDLSEHQFILCPKGNGIDTHRFWEALYFGAVPVVKNSLYMDSYRGVFPILFIEDWSEFQKYSPQDLNRLYQDQFGACDRELLKFEHWRRRIKVE